MGTSGIHRAALPKMRSYFYRKRVGLNCRIEVRGGYNDKNHFFQRLTKSGIDRAGKRTKTKKFILVQQSGRQMKSGGWVVAKGVLSRSGSTFSTFSRY
jgi:hypothetical protein